ncbi:MAG: radical SAM protein [Candidatus Woesearchaeota archaeon]
MTKVIFVQNLWFPFEAVGTLSAALKNAGHKVGLSIGEDEKVIREIKEFDPDIIAFSVITANRKYMMDTAKLIRQNEIKALIVVGGHDASFFPEIIQNPYIDIICRGEGDDVIVELADAIDKKQDYSKILNLWVKKDGKIIKNDIRPFKDVNERLFEDREIYRDYSSYFRDIEFGLVMVGRGCPYSCSYCFNHKYREMYAHVDKKYCALRDVDNVIKECVMIKEKYKIKNIFFNDSTLGYDKKWLREFLNKYKEKVDLPFTINSTVNEVDDEYCKLLADTKKCFIIRLGLETGNEKFRMTTLNKKLTNEQYIKATDLFKKYNLKYSMSIMLGLPGETLENAFETLDFAAKISSKNSVVAVNIFKPFPRLSITEYGVKIGQYDKTLIQDSSMIGDTTMNFYDCFRRDKDGKKIILLSRWSQIYINFPLMREFIKNVIINTPDNVAYRILWRLSDGYFTNRHHVNASWGYLLKYIFKHRMKKVTV